jgi:hypothetical protein
MAGWFLPRRDCTIVARHEVPCSLDIERGTRGDSLVGYMANPWPEVA